MNSPTLSPSTVSATAFKDEISNVFTQLVLLLSSKGLVTLDVEYIDGTKIESKANKYTFVCRKDGREEPRQADGEDKDASMPN